MANATVARIFSGQPSGSCRSHSATGTRCPHMTAQTRRGPSAVPVPGPGGQVHHDIAAMSAPSAGGQDAGGELRAGHPVDCGDQQPFPRPPGAARPGTARPRHRRGRRHRGNQARRSRDGRAGGIAGHLRSGPAGRVPGLAGAVVTVMHLQGWVMGWCQPGGDSPREAAAVRSCTDADPRPTPRGTSSPAGPPRPGAPRAMHQALAPALRPPGRRRCAGARPRPARQRPGPARPHARAWRTGPRAGQRATGRTRRRWRARRVDLTIPAGPSVHAPHRTDRPPARTHTARNTAGACTEGGTRRDRRSR